MRLFTAVDIGEKGKDILCEAMLRLKNAGLSGHFTPRENLHVTLVFIGETPGGDKIKAAMDEIQSQHFDIAVRGIGIFPREGGGILWAGAESDGLIQRQKELHSVLAAQGFTLENQAYRPHITLCRRTHVPERTVLSSFSPDFSSPIDRVNLYRSDPGPRGPKYTEIYSKKLLP